MYEPPPPGSFFFLSISADGVQKAYQQSKWDELGRRAEEISNWTFRYNNGMTRASVMASIEQEPESDTTDHVVWDVAAPQGDSVMESLSERLWKGEHAGAVALAVGFQDGNIEAGLALIASVFEAMVVGTPLLRRRRWKSIASVYLSEADRLCSRVFEPTAMRQAKAEREVVSDSYREAEALLEERLRRYYAARGVPYDETEDFGIEVTEHPETGELVEGIFDYDEAEWDYLQWDEGSNDWLPKVKITHLPR